MEDFLRDTSAVRTQVYSDDEKRFVTGVTHFNGFVDAMLRACATATKTEDGFTAFSVLHNATEQRYFQPDDDETASHYAARLQREATTMDATWLFTAMLAPGRTFKEGEEPEPVDVDNPEELQAALESGAMQLGICWYADCREERNPVRRSGLIVLDNEDFTIVSYEEGEIEAEHNPFHHVMERT